MRSRGKYPIYFTGSNLTLWRVVWEDENGKTFCKWYGELIAIRRGFSGYFETIEQY